MTFQEWFDINGIVHHYFDDIYDGLEKIIGQRLWICDYRLNPIKSEKPARYVSPKFVEVFLDDDTNNKPIYYSPIYFREVKGEKILKQVIAPFDNTGYRSYSGVSVNIFDNEEECRKCFRRQCETAILEYRNKIDSIEIKIEEIEKIIVDNL